MRWDKWIPFKTVFFWVGSFDEERIIMLLILQFWSKSAGLPTLSPPPLLYLTVDVPGSISRAWLLLVEGWSNLHLADFCETMVQMPKYIVQGAFMGPPYPWVLLSNMATTCLFLILSCPCGISTSLPSLCRLHKENEWLSSCHHSIALAQLEDGVISEMPPCQILDDVNIMTIAGT